MPWRPMTDNPFPWKHKDVLLACYAKDDPAVIEVLRCTCAEHGAYFEMNSTFLSVHETGWIPFAFMDDDVPAPDPEKWPPMLTDYLTETQS